MPEWFKEYAVDRGGKYGTLFFYQTALKLRKAFAEVDDIRWLESITDTVLFRRGRWQVMTNFGKTESVTFPPGRVILSSSKLLGGFRLLPPCTTIWLEDE